MSGSFNPRTHTGCDRYLRELRLFMTAFQSTHPHGVRLTSGFINAEILHVSIHAPTRGATLSRIDNLYIRTVSIHAPTRGATPTVKVFRIARGVSIHAPTRGATLPSAAQLYELMFQSTHPHGVRRRARWLSSRTSMFQSTHPHGVRLPASTSSILLYTCFNPRTHTGCDTRVQVHGDKFFSFQSTHPHGVRLESPYRVNL